MLRQGPLTTLLDTDTVEVELFDEPEAVKLALEARGAAVSVAGRTLTVRIDSDDAYDLVRDAIAQSGGSIRRMGTRAQSLEDVFLRAEEGAR